MKKIKSATLDVLNATEVDVEATFTKGLPSFSIVGLVSTVIQESKDRIKSALIMNDFKFPPKKITINLSPSDITKSGTHFDLSIALLIALYETKVVFEDFFIFGELGLDGQLKDTKNIFPLILSLAQKNKDLKILAPTQSNKTLSLIPNIKLYCVNTFIEAINFFMQEDKSDFLVKNSEVKSSKINVLNHNYFYSSNYPLDFLDVKGQKVAKRAALISASGNHNILFEGSPGSGKSMISKRLEYIQSPMSINDILHKAKMDCLDLKEVDFEPRRVFRSPHNSSTKASIFGGGTSQSKIGEIALCHGGILFFDEFPHFQKGVIEALREPLEDYQILISRVNSKIRYETKFLFIAAQNPCPCGNLQNTLKECRCHF